MLRVNSAVVPIMMMTSPEKKESGNGGVGIEVKPLEEKKVPGDGNKPSETKTEEEKKGSKDKIVHMGCKLCTPDGDFNGYENIGDFDIFKDKVDWDVVKKDIREKMTPPLHLAAAEADMPSLISFVEVGKHYVDELDQASQTPLQHAVWCSDPLRICGHLLRFGANINSKDKLGATVFMNAIRANVPLELIKEMIKSAKEIDINAQDNQGSTALHLAVDNDRDDIVQLLLKIPGISLRLLDRRACTAFRLASAMNRAKIQNMLLNFQGA